VTSTVTRTGSPSRRRRPLATIGALLLTLSLSACSGDSSDPSADPSGDPSSSEATDAPPLETTATLGKVTGKLPKGKRSKVRKQVGRAVDAWFEAAYVGGDYPRNDFAASWPGFTTGAKSDARSDKALMSNQDIGSQISSVEPTARKVTVDVVAVRGRAVGTTARVVLKFRTDGDVQRQVQVRGRLFLTPTPEGWRIFGYDVTKGRGA
jgi:hypothetical protein